MGLLQFLTNTIIDILTELNRVAKTIAAENGDFEKPWSDVSCARCSNDSFDDVWAGKYLWQVEVIIVVSIGTQVNIVHLARLEVDWIGLVGIVCQG